MREIFQIFYPLFHVGLFISLKRRYFWISHKNNKYPEFPQTFILTLNFSKDWISRFHPSKYPQLHALTEAFLPFWPLIGGEWSRDLNTLLWLVHRLGRALSPLSYRVPHLDWREWGSKSKVYSSKVRLIWYVDQGKIFSVWYFQRILICMKHFKTLWNLDI